MLDHAAVADRIHQQTKDFDRAWPKLKDQEGFEDREWRGAKLPNANLGPAFSRNADMSDKGRVIAASLSGGYHPVYGEPSEALDATDLFSSYKDAPHQPASVFLKYLVHRINNADLYDDHTAGHKADVQFLRLHQMGDAGLSNNHLVPDDLHKWTQRWAPTVVPQLLAERERVQGHVKRGIGLNVREFNGEPYVALTRGLDSDIMNREHALSSWSDQKNSGFGQVQHHAWVPLRDLWHSYDMGTDYAAGNLGSEDEYLLSHTAPRYQATPDDVKTSRVKASYLLTDNNHPFPYHAFYDDATDEALADGVRHFARGTGTDDEVPNAILHHKNFGPKATEALKVSAGGKPLSHALSIVPREQVMAEAVPMANDSGLTTDSFKNPHLTMQDVEELGRRAVMPSPSPYRDHLVRAFVEAPKASTEMVDKLWDQGASKDREVNHILVGSPLASHRVLEDAANRVMSPDTAPKNAPPPPSIRERTLLAESILSNPQHNSEQAWKVLEYGWRNGLSFVSSWLANLSPEKVYHLAQVANKKADLYPGALDQLGGEGMRRAASVALQNYAGLNPRADGEVLANLIDEGGVDPVVIAYRAKRHLANPYPPEVQVPLIEKLTKLALAGGQHSNEDSNALVTIAYVKGLTPDAKRLMANNPLPTVRALFYRNKDVSAQDLENAWPKGLVRPAVPKGEETLRRIIEGYDKPDEDGNPIPFSKHLAAAIEARRRYEAKRNAEHVIKPFPAGMAKSENDAWKMQFRHWLADQEDKKGFYHACSRGEADDIVYYHLLHPKPTEDILDGEAVWADRASPEVIKEWQRTARPGEDALVYFETSAEPQQHEDGRFYWTGIVPVEHAHVVEPGTVVEKSEEVAALGRVLFKMHGPITFPRLGVPDDRRETDIISTKRQLELKARAFAQADVNQMKGLIGQADQDMGDAAPPSERALAARRAVTVRDVTKPDAISPGMAHESGLGYAITPSPWSRHSMTLQATVPHEDMHLLLNRVQARYGREGRRKLVANMMEALPHDLRQEVVGLATKRQKGSSNPMAGEHEEALTYILSYLNDPKERKRKLGSDPARRHAIHERLKRAYQYLRAAAEVATPAWTQHLRPWQVRANVPAGTQTDFADVRSPYGPWAHTQDNPWGNSTRPQPRLWTGQFVNKSEVEEVPMMKGLKEAILAGALALAPAATSHTDSYKVPPPPPKWMQVEVVEQLHPHLQAIRHLESADGTLLNHAKHPKGEYHTAYGDVGLKPVTAHETWRRSKKLQSKYPGLNDPGDFTKAIKAMPGLYNASANAHWGELLRAFNGDARRAAYGWRWGRGAAGAATPEDLDSDQYVQAFSEHPRVMLAMNKAETIAPTSVLEPGEADAARAQLGHVPEVDVALRAALFLVGRKVRINEDAFALSISLHEGDIQRAALNAVGLTDDDRNLRALRAVIAMGEWEDESPVELTKAEGDVQAPNISSVQPAVPAAEDTAEEVMRAVDAGALHPLKLKGKHAAGATAAKDPQTGHIWLLKPGSGKQSPAAGARDDKSGQSAREAAFWHVADHCGMSRYYPRADLLIVNAQEWAVMSMLGTSWKGLDEYDRSKDGKARDILAPYLKRGDCHRLAVMDWFLGNPDSHGQNIMTHAQSVALIDHGSAFAGPNFKPGLDEKSFVPYYIRVFAARGFSKMRPEDRIKTMPVLDQETDDYVRAWVKDLKPGVIDQVMDQYGIGHTAREAVLSRLHDLQTTDAPSFSAYLNGLWAGLRDSSTT